MRKFDAGTPQASVAMTGSDGSDGSDGNEQKNKQLKMTPAEVGDLTGAQARGDANDQSGEIRNTCETVVTPQAGHPASEGGYSTAAENTAHGSPSAQQEWVPTAEVEQNAPNALTSAEPGKDSSVEPTTANKKSEQNEAPSLRERVKKYTAATAAALVFGWNAFAGGGTEFPHQHDQRHEPSVQQMEQQSPAQQEEQGKEAINQLLETLAEENLSHPLPEPDRAEHGDPPDTEHQQGHKR